MPSAETVPAGRVPFRALYASVLVVLAAGLAWEPWMAFGVILGGGLLALTLRWPLAVVAAMLAIGPLDLSFLTGGFKSLFERLGGLDMNGIRLIFVSAGLGLVIATDRVQWPRLASPPVRWYLAFLVYATVTVGSSLDPVEGLRLLLKLAWPLLVFLVVSRPGRSWAEIGRLTDWLLVGAAVLIVINPVFVVQGDLYVEETGAVRLMGAGTHQNPFSFAMLAVVLVCLGRFATRAQARYLALAAGALFWIGLTFTRITFLAGVAALGVVALYAAFVRRNWRGALAGLGAGVAVVLVMAPAALFRTFGYVPGPADLAALARDPVALYQAVNWSGREIFWSVLALSWMESPWVGLGLGSSSGILKSLFPPEMGLVAHNEYLRLGVDAGFVGLALFTAAMMAWVREVARAGRSPDPRIQEVALPALAVMVAWGVISITDNAFDYYAPLTQVAGFLVGASLVPGRERP
jgi:O-antigen ligase